MWYKGSLPEHIINNEYKTLNYIKEDWNDDSTVKDWIDTYGSIFNTGEMADYRSYQPDWTNNIIDYLNFQKVGSSFYKMKPGIIIPYHSDTYKKYIQYYNITNVQTIHRALILLEDWQPGHILEVGGEPIYHYKKGDFVVWQYDTPHMAANLGTTVRYTLQITGIL